MNTEQSTEVPEKNENRTPATGRSMYVTQRYQSKNLLFLTTLMDSMSMTVQQFAMLTDNPNSFGTNLRRYLKMDDMKISKAKEYVAILGYNLDINFKETFRTIPPTPETQAEQDYDIILPPELERTYDAEAASLRNVGFLLTMMKLRRITKMQLAMDLDLSTGTVFEWFRNDDMYVSYLTKIQEMYGLRLEYAYKKK